MVINYISKKNMGNHILLFSSFTHTINIYYYYR
nr:MAG TPA: hypothetical protein [Caudoviricetes sp.]